MKEIMDFSNGKELLALCTDKNKPISEVMLLRETEKFGSSREAVWKRMRESFEVMRESVGRSQTEQMRLLGGYIGGESKALLARILREGAMGGMISRASAYAMGVIELNASMGRIVAAPTAGSAGVIPGILVAVHELYDFGEDALIGALFNAGAVGYLIDRNAGGGRRRVGYGGVCPLRAVRRQSCCMSCRGGRRYLQYFGTCLRSDRRARGIPMPETKCHGGGERCHQRGDGACDEWENLGPL